MWDTLGTIVLWIFALIGMLTSLLWVYAWLTEEKEEKPKKVKRTTNDKGKKTKNK